MKNRFLFHLTEVIFTKKGETKLSTRYFPNKINKFYRLLQQGNPALPRPEKEKKVVRGRR